MKIGRGVLELWRVENRPLPLTWPWLIQHLVLPYKPWSDKEISLVGFNEISYSTIIWQWVTFGSRHVYCRSTCCVHLTSRCLELSSADTERALISNYNELVCSGRVHCLMNLCKSSFYRMDGRFQSSFHANCSVMWISLPCGERQFIAYAGLTCYRTLFACLWFVRW